MSIMKYVSDRDISRHFILGEDSNGFYFRKIQDNTGTGYYRQPNLGFRDDSFAALSYRPSSDNRTISNCPRVNITGATTATGIKCYTYYTNVQYSFHVCPSRIYGGQSDTLVEEFFGRTSGASWFANEVQGGIPYFTPGSAYGNSSGNMRTAPIVEAYYLIWMNPSTACSIYDVIAYNTYGSSNPPAPTETYKNFTSTYDGLAFTGTEFPFRDTGKTSGSYHLYVLHVVIGDRPTMGTPVLRATVPVITIKSTGPAMIAFAGWTYEMYKGEGYWDAYDP